MAESNRLSAYKKRHYTRSSNEQSLSDKPVKRKTYIRDRFLQHCIMEQRNATKSFSDNAHMGGKIALGEGNQVSINTFRSIQHAQDYGLCQNYNNWKQDYNRHYHQESPNGGSISGPSAERKRVYNLPMAEKQAYWMSKANEYGLDTPKGQHIANHWSNPKITRKINEIKNKKINQAKPSPNVEAVINCPPGYKPCMLGGSNFEHHSELSGYNHCCPMTGQSRIRT